MMTKGERYIVFLMNVHAPSGLSKVEEKQQFQTIINKDLQDPDDNERVIAQKEHSEREEKSIAD